MGIKGYIYKRLSPLSYIQSEGTRVYMEKTCGSNQGDIDKRKC